MDRLDVAERVDRGAEVGFPRAVGDEDQTRALADAVCCIDLIETSCAPNCSAIAASTPG